MPPSSSTRRRRRRSNSDGSEDAFQPRRRRSSRGNSSLTELAKEICLYQKKVVFITGAGISVASGIRPFRGNSGVWSQHIWSTATREAFRKDPLEWYNDFWIPCLSLPENAKPNHAHTALADLMELFPQTLRMITQNVDGLHTPGSQVIEAHGRVGLFKCMPEEDSDTDSDSDDDDDRLVHLGHRRKRRLAMKKKKKEPAVLCPYRQEKSIAGGDLEPIRVRCVLETGKDRLKEPPRCPSCNNTLAPQALLFDEGYHSHDFYQFQKMEDWLASAEVIVFVGTSFAVRLPEIALEHARAESIPVYNFNTQDMLGSTVRLNATNITGPSEDTIPALLHACLELQVRLGTAPPGARSTSTRSSTRTVAGRELAVQT